MLGLTCSVMTSASKTEANVFLSAVCLSVHLFAGVIRLKMCVHVCGDP